MTEAEIVETALLSLKLNIESIGWEEEGLAFTVPDLYSDEPVTLDLRDWIYRA